MGKDKSAEERGIHYKFNNLGARGFQHFNPILGEGGRIPPPMTFSTVAPWKTVQSGGHGVCKSKLWHWQDTRKDFRSKIFFGSDLEALKVGLPENFGTLKSRFFTFQLDFRPQSQGLGPKMIMDHKDIGLSFHIQKIWGQMALKWVSNGNFSVATWISLKICILDK